MRAHRLLTLGAILLFVFAGTPSPKTVDVRAEVQAFVKNYVEAGNKTDVTAMMEMISHKEGVTSIGDGAITRGWEAIRTENDEMVGKEGLYKISMGSIDVLPLGANHAVAIAPHTITLATDAGQVQVAGAVTFVLEKSANGWKLVHEHASHKVAE